MRVTSTASRSWFADARGSLPISLKNAHACLDLLGADATAELEQELSNAANFGMAKSFFMAGKDAGFDMSSEAEIQLSKEWAVARSVAADATRL